jgi:hypothetical protein
MGHKRPESLHRLDLHGDMQQWPEDSGGGVSEDVCCRHRRHSAAAATSAGAGRHVDRRPQVHVQLVHEPGVMLDDSQLRPRYANGMGFAREAGVRP